MQQTSRPVDQQTRLIPTEEIRSARDLQVYRLAYESAKKIHVISLTFPKLEQYALADQLRRSSKSINANLVEGYAKKGLSVPEFKRFLNIAYGSAEEMQVWLDFATDLGYLQTQDSLELRENYTQICKMLWSLIKKWSQK